MNHPRWDKDFSITRSENSRFPADCHLHAALKHAQIFIVVLASNNEYINSSWIN